MKITLFFLLSLLLAAPAAADQPFVAELIPQPGTGSTASGTAMLVLDDAETSVSYDIQITGLSSAEVEAHIHRPDGSIAHTLPMGSPKTGVWTGVGFIDATELKLGRLFILVHTDANPFGELRGNIKEPQVPVEPTTWGAIKELFAVGWLDS